MSKEKLFYWGEHFRKNALRPYIEKKDPLFLQEYDISLKEEFDFGQTIVPLGSPGALRALIDRKGEHLFTINPVIRFPWQEDEYYSKVDNYTFSDVMIETAKWVAAPGKTIDFFWSGGTDSNAALLALNEVCPKQLHIIIGESHECPEIYEKIVKHLDHHIDHTGQMYGIPQPDKHILTTMAEADLFFGASRVENKHLIDKGWETRRRYLYSYATMRFFMHFEGEKIDINNIRPFCAGPLLEKWMINYVKNGKMVFWFSNDENEWPPPGSRANEDNWINCKGQEHYKNCKMPLRDYIFEMTGNRDIAYNNIKLAGTARGLGGKFKPKPRVLAVTEDGYIIHRKNYKET